MSQVPSPTYAQPPAEGNPWAVKTPVGRAILLFILSLGLWGFWWFYDTRDKLNRELGKQDESAGLYTLGLLVPILNWFIIYWLWRDINDLRTRMGLEEFPVVVYLVLALVIPFAAIVIYVIVLGKVNEYWDVRSQGQATDVRVTGLQLVLTLIGAAFWLLMVLIIVIALIAVGTSSS